MGDKELHMEDDEARDRAAQPENSQGANKRSSKEKQGEDVPDGAGSGGDTAGTTGTGTGGGMSDGGGSTGDAGGASYGGGSGN